MSFKLLERVAQAEIGARLEPLVAEFATRREPGEGFGDFCNRIGYAGLLDLIEAQASDAA
jgi:sulfite reductase beta subunit-like hemoprotein